MKLSYKLGSEYIDCIPVEEWYPHKNKEKKRKEDVLSSSLNNTHLWDCSFRALGSVMYLFIAIIPRYLSGSIGSSYQFSSRELTCFKISISDINIWQRLLTSKLMTK